MCIRAVRCSLIIMNMFSNGMSFRIWMAFSGFFKWLNNWNFWYSDIFLANRRSLFTVHEIRYLQRGNSWNDLSVARLFQRVYKIFIQHVLHIILLSTRICEEKNSSETAGQWLPVDISTTTGHIRPRSTGGRGKFFQQRRCCYLLSRAASRRMQAI